MPTDRESVFFISMKAIPAQAQNDQPQSVGQMAVTVVSNMKLFYRPAGLAKRAVADVACQLRFNRSGKELIANKPDSLLAHLFAAENGPRRAG
ncbi:Chaperone protein fimC precursor [Serratia fonticola]|uniref:Chaperone protein fimC n=1 Tax=Serratia fonticola TaxID=47917 RepID=A0A4U9WIZ5_SERFO|nr:Chaperone protein fimC precursor [Serratia fonticola]